MSDRERVSEAIELFVLVRVGNAASGVRVTVSVVALCVPEPCVRVGVGVGGRVDVAVGRRDDDLDASSDTEPVNVI